MLHQSWSFSAIVCYVDVVTTALHCGITAGILFSACIHTSVSKVSGILKSLTLQKDNEHIFKGMTYRGKIGPKKSSPTRPRPAGIKARPSPSPTN